MIGPVWRRDAVIDFNGSVIRSEELFFVHRTRRFDPSTRGRTALERSYIHGHRWCDAATIDELVAGGETVYPAAAGRAAGGGQCAGRRARARSAARAAVDPLMLRIKHIWRPH